MGISQASGDALNMQLFTCLTYSLRSLLFYVILKSCVFDERILSNFFGVVTKFYRENKDSGRNGDDRCPPNDRGVGNGDGGDDGENMSEDGEDGDSYMEYFEDESFGSDEDGEDDDDENDGYDSRSIDESSDDEPLLKHARQHYSEKSFLIFEHEYKKSMALSADGARDNNEVFEYEVKLGPFNTHRRVLAFFYEQIPEHYLLKWRMKSEIPATKLSIIKEKNDKQGRCSSDDNFPNKSINRSLHEKKFEEHFTSVTEGDEDEDEDEGYSDDAEVGAPLLWHAKEIYVSNIADMFQKEYINSQYLSTTHFIESVEEESFMVECEVFKPHSGKCKTVRAYPADGTINCSCNKFERDRILCCHALAVLDRLFIVRIPPQYLHEKFLKHVAPQVKDIHGPRYSEHGLFLCYSMVQRMVGGHVLPFDLHMITARSLFKQFLATASSKPVDVKENHGEAKRQKEQKKKVRFSDDQALKNLVYKELKLLDGASEETKSRRKRQISHFLQCPNRGMARSRLAY